jgi:hypothetical protein
MIEFTTRILQFDQQGEKTGWTYVEIPVDIAEKLQPGNKKSFRVKGKLDDHAIKGVSLLPMGGGKFIMALNGAMRKAIHKKKGAMLKLKLEVDKQGYQLNREFMKCLEDEPIGLNYFNSLPKSHQNYFSKWIESAKTDATRTKRIAVTVNALSRKMNFVEMLRWERSERDQWK